MLADSDREDHLAQIAPLDFVWLLDRIWRFIDVFGFRMTQGSGGIDATFVSVVEAENILSGLSTGGFNQKLGIARPQPHTDRSPRTPWSVERLQALSACFGLDPLEACLMAAATAPALSLDIARMYTFAWADFVQKRPSVGFLAELIADEPDEVLEAQVAFMPDGRLVQARLVELKESTSWGDGAPLIHREVVVPESVVTYLRGQPPRLPGSLVGAARLISGPSIDDSHDEAEPSFRFALSALGASGSRPLPVILVGAPGSGRRSWTRGFASRLSRHILDVRTDRLPSTDENALADAVREARLHGALLVLDCDEWVARGNTDVLEALGEGVSRLLADGPVPVVLLTGVTSPVLARTVHRAIEIRLPLPSEAEQRGLWAEQLAGAGLQHEESLSAHLALRFNASPGQIREAIADTRRDLLLRAGTAAAPAVELHHIASQIRRRVAHALDDVATPVETSVGWDAVVLPSDTRDQLREIVTQARLRSKVFDQWGMRHKMPNGRGLACLFAGPPGTGKTMVAGVIARELGRELYRIDVSRVVSKWVGETEKNLARVFAEAEKAQVILLFDEADSLFAKRTEVKAAQDRFANMEVNFLLQKMEDYDGISFLTTNFERSLDEALKRRLRFRVSFPKPDVDERLHLWQRLMPEDMPIDGDIDYERLARKYKLTGALVRNAILRAAFFVADEESAMTTRHLVRAVELEMRDMGRL